MDHSQQALAQIDAQDAKHRAMRPEPGDTRRPPTIRQGVVTQASPLQVDGAPAHPLVHVGALSVGQVVLLLVQGGARYVLGRL